MCKTIANPVALGLLIAALPWSEPAAQTPAAAPPPPPGWAGSAGAGLALTSGNSDTSSTNVTFELKRETGSATRFKSAALFLRAESEGQLTSNRLTIDARVDREFSERTSIYGQGQYLRDSFKEIDYLVSPTVGVGHRLVQNDRSEFAVDAGVGLVWEKNPDAGVRSDGALTAGQDLKHQISPTASVTQRIAALWKINDLNDALYTFAAGLAASITTAVQMKVEVIDTYKTRPPSVDVVRNDVAVLVSALYKFD